MNCCLPFYFKGIKKNEKKVKNVLDLLKQNKKRNTKNILKIFVKLKRTDFDLVWGF